MPSGEHPNSKKNLQSFKPGVPTNPAGKKPGTKNRATIARQVLAMVAKFPEEVFAKLKVQYPEMEKEMTMEEMMVIVMSNRAITKQDPQAFNAIMNSAYGLPKQELDMTSAGEQILLPPITFTKKQT